MVSQPKSAYYQRMEKLPARLRRAATAYRHDPPIARVLLAAADNPPRDRRRLTVLRELEARAGNISATARALSLHRRTLQRWLAKWGAL